MEGRGRVGGLECAGYFGGFVGWDGGPGTGVLDRRMEVEVGY